MSTPTGGSGFMTEEAPRPATPERELVEARPGGYRIFARKPPAEQQKVQEIVKKRERGRRINDRVLQLIDYAFSLLYALLGLRLVMGLVAANEQAGFVEFIKAVTQPFYGPFAEIVPSPTLTRGTFDVSIVVALWVYLMLHIALRRLPRILLGAPRAT